MTTDENWKYKPFALIVLAFAIMIGFWVVYYVLAVKNPVEYVPLDTEERQP